MSEAGTNIKIKLVSSITSTDGDVETYEMWLQGIRIEKNGNEYLRYEEIQEEYTIKTTIKITMNQALILRSGGVRMRLPLNLQQKESGHYDSDYGVLPLMTKTHALVFERLQDGKQRRFYTEYDLIVGGVDVGHYKLEIHYSEGLA